MVVIGIVAIESLRICNVSSLIHTDLVAVRIVGRKSTSHVLCFFAAILLYIYRGKIFAAYTIARLVLAAAVVIKDAIRILREAVLLKM